MMTKTILLAIGILLLASSISAQDAMLTKEETVNYLQKKLREVDGRYETFFGKKFHFNEPTVSLLKDGSVEIVYTSTSSDEFCASGYFRKFSLRFSPGDIATVGIYRAEKENDPVRFISLRFKARTARIREDHWKGPRCQSSISTQEAPSSQWGDTDKLGLPFFATSPENRERITRAILHLRDLANAEDDPFAK